MMKDLFPGYYRPTQEEFDEMWQNGVFVPDANVLLNLYRCSPDTSSTLLDLFSQFSDRLWLPHQVAKEFLSHRMGVISSHAGAYRKATDSLRKLPDAISGQLSDFRRHPYIKVGEIVDRLKQAVEEVVSNLEQQSKDHPDLLADDPMEDEIKAKVTTLFAGSVGAPYKADRLSAIYKDGKDRYEKRIPPGYKDEKKPEDSKFGDLVLWMQILDYAKQHKKTILFITDDGKEDWWWLHEGRTIGPRPELVAGMADEAGVLFYMYSPERFMEEARSRLNRDVSDEAIREVREVAVRDAARADDMAFGAPWNEVQELPTQRRGSVSIELSRFLMLARLARNQNVSWPLIEIAFKIVPLAVSYPQANQVIEHLWTIANKHPSGNFEPLLGKIQTLVPSLEDLEDYAAASRKRGVAHSLVDQMIYDVKLATVRQAIDELRAVAQSESEDV
jgi:PIN domain-containing protein